MHAAVCLRWGGSEGGQRRGEQGSPAWPVGQRPWLEMRAMPRSQDRCEDPGRGLGAPTEARLQDTGPTPGWADTNNEWLGDLARPRVWPWQSGWGGRGLGHQGGALARTVRPPCPHTQWECDSGQVQQSLLFLKQEVRRGHLLLGSGLSHGHRKALTTQPFQGSAGCLVTRCPWCPDSGCCLCSSWASVLRGKSAPCSVG